MSTTPVIAEASKTSVSRRGFFMKLGILFNGFVGLLLAIPVVRFLLSSVTRGRGNGYLSWVRLGAVSEFPEDAVGYVSKSLCDADGRQNGGHSVLGPAY